MFNIGTQELLLIMLVVLLLFGSKRIPEAARSFGQGLRQFQHAVRGIEQEIRQETIGALEDDETTRVPPRRPRAEASVPREISSPTYPGVEPEPATPAAPAEPDAVIDVDGDPAGRK